VWDHIHKFAPNINCSKGNQDVLDALIIKRIGNIRLLDASRAQFDDSVSSKDLKELVKERRLKALQCSTPIKDAVWALLNDVFFAARPDVELRVYHCSTGCDLSFLRLMTNLRRFDVDVRKHVKNIEAIADIPRLESLSLGIFELEDFSILELIPSTITSLSLEATRSRKPSLLPLSRLQSLRVLYLEGQSKDIEVLGELKHLEDLTLRSITTRDLGYLAGLSKLWSLDIKLGGIRSFKGIEGKESIKYLELWQIRDLHSVDVVGSLSGLQNLFLQSLPHIKSLPELRNSKSLRRVMLQNMKGLNDFGAFGNAPALEEFALIEGTKQIPEQLLPVLRNPKVRRISAYFGSDRKNREFVRLRNEYGKAELDLRKPFAYR
jgi:hypothetical protein